MKNRIVEASILAVGLFLIGLFIYFIVSHITDCQRILSVIGLAERAVLADLVTCPLSFPHTGTDLSNLFYLTVNLNNVII